MHYQTPILVSVLDWAAFAEGMGDKQAWLDWAWYYPAAQPPALQHPPALSAMPAMLRRRASATARVACEVAYATAPQRAAAAATPLVFASRYGDAQRSLGLLADLVAGTAISPTGFGMAVHNAVGALFAIASATTANIQVVTAGEDTVRAAWAEALALLADGASEVVLASYDGPLPEPYTVFHSTAMPMHAWAVRLRLATANKPAAADLQQPQQPRLPQEKMPGQPELPCTFAIHLQPQASEAPASNPAAHQRPCPSLHVLHQLLNAMLRQPDSGHGAAAAISI